jgi:hypothetical protein
LNWGRGLIVSIEERIKALEEELNRLKTELAKQPQAQPQQQPQQQPQEHKVVNEEHKVAIKAKPHVHEFIEWQPGVYKCVKCGAYYVDAQNIDGVLKAFTAKHRHGNGEHDIFNCPVCKPKLTSALSSIGYEIVEKDGEYIIRRKR